MNSVAHSGDGAVGRVPYVSPDYGARALALWPRLDIQRLGRFRHDPRRVATLVSRRTTLSYVAILELLGAGSDDIDAPGRDH
jgi:hypothetical protein